MAQFLFEFLTEWGKQLLCFGWIMMPERGWHVMSKYHFRIVVNGSTEGLKCVIHNTILSSPFKQWTLWKVELNEAICTTVSCTHQSFAFIVIQIAYMLLVLKFVSGPKAESHQHFNWMQFSFAFAFGRFHFVGPIRMQYLICDNTFTCKI